jgi:hypothetical protein
MSKIETGGPAFPGEERVYEAGYATRRFEPVDGMSLRDYFAAKALNGMLANQHAYTQSDEHMFARDSYALADAMLKARKS